MSSKINKIKNEVFCSEVLLIKFPFPENLCLWMYWVEQGVLPEVRVTLKNYSPFLSTISSTSPIFATISATAFSPLAADAFPGFPHTPPGQ